MKKLISISVAALALAGCGSSSSTTTDKSATRPHTRAPAAPVALRPAQTLSLPDAREGTATTLFGGNVYVSGGISSAGASSDTVFRISLAGGAATVATLPIPIHDAAAAPLGSRLLVLGGGQLEGSDRIVQVLPGPPRQVGTLPQALSDLDAAVIGGVAYVVGGWNGTTTNADIYSVSPAGTVTTVGHLPLGVRYPAVAALDGKLLIAGGETQASTPTTDAWAFDPSTRTVTPLPSLPVATDHTTGAVLNGRFYVLGGLRDGIFTDAVISWAPGERRWRPAGHLPAALADLASAPFGDGIAVIGGRGPSGPVTSVTVMRPAR